MVYPLKEQLSLTKYGKEQIDFYKPAVRFLSGFRAPQSETVCQHWADLYGVMSLSFISNRLRIPRVVSPVTTSS